MPAFMDITGQRFGRLVVVERAENDRNGTAQWLCHCDCGAEKIVKGINLRGQTRSCGCYHSDQIALRNKTHGLANRPEYVVWLAMKARCYDPKNKRFPRYGARGIEVCSRWLASFEAFYADMGPRPQGYTLERKHNDKGYSPCNCIWATRVEQARNRGNNHWISFEGETRCLQEWADLYGLKQPTLSMRLKRGWPIERALTHPTKGRSRWR